MGTRKKIVAGNWKMNLGPQEAAALVDAVMKSSVQAAGVLKVFCPPFPFVQSMAERVKNAPGFLVAAQNCSEHEKGAFTGEVSAGMLHAVGCRAVIIGHSERRSYFKEQDGQLKAKISRALENGLMVIFCFGEQLEERRSGDHFRVVKEQLTSVLSGFPKDRLKDLVLAYEPVWAIGTGETATPQQAQEMHAHVRAVAGELFGEDAAAGLSILYGGSCNAANAGELFSCPDVDGGLIGGASLKAEDFSKIIHSF